MAFDTGLNIAFNVAMNEDAELIQRLGGPTKVAELLGYDKKDGGVQRVQNWISRGIPSRVKVERPDIFLVGRVPLAEEGTAA